MWKYHVDFILFFIFLIVDEWMDGNILLNLIYFRENEPLPK